MRVKVVRAPKEDLPPGNILRSSENLPIGEKKVLTAAAQYDDGVTREQLTVLTGYKRSSRDTYLQRLRERGLIDTGGERVTITDAGVFALGPDFQRLPTGSALLAHWMQRLPEGERRILQVLLDQYDAPVERETISEITGYKRSSRDTYLQRLGAKRLVEFGTSGILPSRQLFD